MSTIEAPAPRRLNVYALSGYARVELTDSEIMLARDGGVRRMVLSRAEWIALVELLLPRLSDASRAEFTAEIARGSTGHTT